ncbi:DNA oxidative demethylase AlkB [Asticcacaulis sp. SL142]|uniref:DNA oxidative demethylase AlkB n=1 Tax=Asticcacaulis sp. SL142 TaxID=2995155 RepID=UPI00226C9A72|nr:DNA oxidative demethylase AlkB [Asticcacaulis sp. SL142]WAC46776.1 DNA oxidative demethylase AlkB [Asticcacaulis sp. SL142]
MAETLDLFGQSGPQALSDGAVLIRGFALAQAEALIADIEDVAAQAPFRRLMTPGGKPMSAAMTNCGAAGWVSDRRGYRYEACDPQTGRLWPDMPDGFRDLAVEAAQAAGFEGFDPDACLINLYGPGARMSLHQDRDETDLSQPIVSVSLGLEAVFLWGGMARTDPTQKIILRHGDVVVFGGASRLRFHGIAPLKPGHCPGIGARRYNLTFRRAI